MNLPPAAVIGLDNITGLQTARILADHHVPVVGVVADRRHWGAHTNACVEVVESDLSGDELVSSLRLLAGRLGRRCVLVPCTDLAVETLSRRRDELGDDFLLPLAPHDVVDLLMDKVRFARHAESVGLPVPHMEVLTNRADAVRAAASLEYPCVLKPPVKLVSWTRHTSDKGYAVKDPTELLSVFDTVSAWSPTLLAQEWVTGPVNDLFTCNGYFDEAGQPLVTFVTRKVRQWPPQIGTGASGEECRNDEVLATTVKLFSGLGYRGFGYLEMKRDVRSGRLLVIEANVGRPTGRSATAEAAGVELIYTAYCDSVGLPLPAEREQRYVGAKWLDLRRDVQAALVAHHRGTLTVGEWVRWVRGPKAHAIWSRRDPAPFAFDLMRATVTAARRVGSRLRRRTARRRPRPFRRASILHPHGRGQA
jgi:D-aspartate ligase